MRVLITQSAEDAKASAEALKMRGHDAVVAPLVVAERGPIPKLNLTGAQGFLVTGSDGARALADTVGFRTFPVFADSEVTAATLRALGFKHVHAAKDDSADLARLAERELKPADGALIYACSTAAPVNLPAMLSNMGFAVRPLPLYTLKRADEMPENLRRALQNRGVDTALFLGADEARAFVALVQRHEMEAFVRELPCVATSPVVAAPLRALKLGGVGVPASADLDTVFGALDVKLVDKVEEERAAREARAKEEAERIRIQQEREARQKAERIERERIAREQAEHNRIEGERLAAERAERDRIDRAKAEADRAAKAAEKARLAQERDELRKAEKERAVLEKAERRRVAEEEKARIRAESAAAPAGVTWGTRFKCWFGGTKEPADESPANPVWAMAIGDTPKADPPPPPPVAPPVAQAPPSATIESPIAASRPEPKVTEPKPSEPEPEAPTLKPQAKEAENVSDNSAPDSIPDAPGPVPEQPDAKPAARSGGRAARLLAEDAADQRAKDRRFKYLGHSEAPPPEPEASERPEAATATTAAQANRANRQSRSGAGRALMLFVVLAAVAATVMGTASWWVPRVTSMVQGTPGLTPAESGSAASTLQADINALKARVGVLEQEAVNTVTPDALNAAKQDVNKRLAALEGRAGGGEDGEAVTSLGDSLSSQAKQLTAVSARLATLEAAIGNSARLEDLSKRLNMLEGRSAEANSVLALNDRVTSLETIGRRTMVEQSASIALLMAVAQWREAVLSGHPFKLELETVKALAARSGGIAIDETGFASAADKGLPTLQELQRRFTPMAGAAMRASIIPDGTAPWYRRILDRVFSIVTVRRLDGDAAGTSVSAVLARAQARLIEGDLAASMTEMNSLTGTAATAAAPWLALAKARVAAERAAADATTKTVAALAAVGTADQPAPTPPSSSNGQ